MQLIPLQKKFRLDEDDINNLCAWMIEGRSLEEICIHFDEKMNIEQIFLAATIIAREMYDMSLKELCPDLVAERKEVNQDRYEQWKAKKQDRHLMALLNDIIDDLSLYEMELAVSISSI